jgi:hypothetical protein
MLLYDKAINEYKSLGRKQFGIGNGILEETQFKFVHHKSHLALKNCVFWHVTPCGSCNNRRFGGI